MTKGLVRYQTRGHTHFVTFSCYKRSPYLITTAAKHLFEDALERTRISYGLYIFAYVVMPEHVHLLLSEPRKGLLADAVKALKLSTTLRRPERPFWQARYYDFNVFKFRKHLEKLRYIHRNPVTRGLVSKPEDYSWSSYHHHTTGEQGTVEIESQWTARRRELSSIS